MKKDIIYENITAYVDGEKTDEKLNFESDIKSNKDFEFEYRVQSSVKRIVASKGIFTPCPEYLKERIKKEIREVIINNVNRTNEDTNKKLSLSDLLKIIFKPQLALAGAFIAVILMFLFSSDGNKNFAELIELQLGNKNMLFQARSNFENILAGKLKPQIISANSEIIKNYFRQSGVNYSSEVTECKNWNLLGGVVSEENGVKLAHHVYEKDGMLIYIYQAKKDYFLNDKILFLSSDLIEKIEESNYLICEKEYKTIATWEKSGNIFVLVSNSPVKTLEDTFLSNIL